MEKRWEDMQQDILESIIRTLPVEDFVSFGSVCSSWRRLVARNEMYDERTSAPWLMLADNMMEKRGFYNLSREVIHEVSLPEARGTKCLSSGGWIMTVDKEWRVHIMNPLSRSYERIELPSLHHFPGIEMAGIDPERIYADYIQRFVLSRDPCRSRDFEVMVIHDPPKGNLGLWRLGDEAWTVIESTGFPHCDVINYRGQFVAVDLYFNVVLIDTRGSDSRRGKVVLEMPDGGMLSRGPIVDALYLVESGGRLLLVSREREESVDVWEVSGTYGFQVLEANMVGKAWKEIECLGSRSIFLGHNSSFSFSSSSSSVQSSIQPNCIYFTDDYFEQYGYFNIQGGVDMGIYSMEHHDIQPHFKGESYSSISPPLWLQPHM